jgi:hypothetical protein
MKAYNAFAPSGNHYTAHGNKAWQREGAMRVIACPHCGNEIEFPDDEDRSLPFRKALCQYSVPVTDIDFVVTNRRGQAQLVLEVTRCERVYSMRYLEAIDERRARGTRGNNNDRLIEELATLLHVRAMLVVFEPNVCDAGAKIWRRWIETPGLWMEWDAATWFEQLRKYTR